MLLCYQRDTASYVRPVLAIYLSLFLATENHRRMTVQYELYGQGQQHRPGGGVDSSKEQVPLYKDVRGRPLLRLHH